jgi:serine protease Do
VGELTLRAEILAFDKDKDLAVLRILSETTPLQAAARVAPDGYKLAQGNVVWAIGNPVGLENTVTRGIISHLFREVQIGPDEKAHYMQTDAAIAGGSSGGALYSDEGFLIGVPSAGYRGTALNFAIPFDIFKRFLRANGFASAWDDKAPSREQFLKDAAEKAEKAK